MTNSTGRLPPTQDTRNQTMQKLEELKSRIDRGDPIAIYEAILETSGAKFEMPEWLAERLLKLISEYHLGEKPSWKGVGNRPILVLRKRLELDIKRRAVVSIRNWQKDSDQFKYMPKRCIRAFSRGCLNPSDFTTLEDAVLLARLGIRGTRVQEGGPLIKCSPRTLRRVYQTKEYNQLPPIPGRIAEVFGLINPDSLFGSG